MTLLYFLKKILKYLDTIILYFLYILKSTSCASWNLYIDSLFPVLLYWEIVDYSSFYHAQEFLIFLRIVKYVDEYSFLSTKVLTKNILIGCITKYFSKFMRILSWFINILFQYKSTGEIVYCFAFDHAQKLLIF